MSAILHRRPSPAAGFTLLEVLVAAAVLAVMMTILLTSVSTSLSLWRNTENRISADREGRSAHLLLAQDLANAVVPTNPNSAGLWPKITENGTKIGFLTTRSSDYQNAAGGDVGDVCYVEYLIQSNGIYRRFAGSKETYESLKSRQLPANTAAEFQLLGDNIIANTNALKGTPVMKTASDVAAIRTNFVALSFVPSGTGLSYQAAGNNRPDAIEVNVAAADADAIRNLQLANLPNYQIRSAGFYTFRVNLPK